MVVQAKGFYKLQRSCQTNQWPANLRTCLLLAKKELLSAKQVLAPTLVILSNTRLQKWGQTESTTQLQNEGSTMVLNGIVNFGRNDHKAATQDNFRSLIMAFWLHEGKFAF